MPSTSLARANDQLSSARYLCRAATDNSTTYGERQILYHASLAASVASWNNYIRMILREYYDSLRLQNNKQLSQFSLFARNMLDKELEKFNTPNFENSRNLIFITTGFDSFSYWNWAGRKMSSVQINSYLNEILKVRHSFAHGHAMPSYSWTQGKHGAPRLTKVATVQINDLIKHLCKLTDKELSRFLSHTFGAAPPW